MKNDELTKLGEDLTEKSSADTRKTKSSSKKKNANSTGNKDVSAASKKASSSKKATKSEKNDEVAISEDKPVVKKTASKKSTKAKAVKSVQEPADSALAEDASVKKTSAGRSSTGKKSLKKQSSADIGILDLEGVKKLLRSVYSPSKQLSADDLDAYIEHLDLTDDEYDSLLTELKSENLIADDSMLFEDIPLDDIADEDLFADKVAAGLEIDRNEEDENGENVDVSDHESDDEETDLINEDDEDYINRENDSKNLTTFSMYSKALNQYHLLTSEEEVELAKRMEKGKEAKARLDQAEKGEIVLDENEMANLNDIVEDGQDAKDTLIQCNLKLVMKIAHYYLHRGMDYEDLVQEGNLGLMKAADKFDYTKGFKFSTYATWWIRQAITRAIADLSRTIRIPVHMVETINRINKARSTLQQKLNRDPTLEELSDYLGDDFTPEKIQDVMKYSQTPLSLDKTVGDDENTHIGDFQADTSNISPYEYAENSYKTDVINKALDELLPREALVIRLRYGLTDGRCHKLDEIGRELNVTRERIRQIESTALNKLKKMDSIKALREKPDKKY